MKLVIRQPDDWHLHLRDGDAMRSVLPHTVARFARAIVMPNLRPPVTTSQAARAYRQSILDALPVSADFEPLMTLYLTDNTDAEEIIRAHKSGFVHAVKLYPAGATTNSDSGVTRMENTWPALEAMQDCGMPLLVHGEVTAPQVDVFDRETCFIDQVLEPLVRRFPGLKLVLEHITTRQGIEFVLHGGDQLAGTLTAHHLLLNRNAIFTGGIRPHNYCLPILKRETHREALIEAATGGNPKFFLGTDSAPHSRQAKESACGCAGLYTAHAAIELYAEAFEQVDRLDRLEDFAACFGADFYGLARNERRITLVKEDWQVPESYPLGREEVVPMRAGESIHWRLEQVSVHEPVADNERP